MSFTLSAACLCAISTALPHVKVFVSTGYAFEILPPGCSFVNYLWTFYRMINLTNFASSVTAALPRLLTARG